MTSDNSAAARKRRIQQRRRTAASEEEDEAWEPPSKRSKREAAADSDDNAVEEDEAVELENDSTIKPPRLVPSIRGIKKQTRYEPGVPMTKEELTAWRKEARRVRNRESAAASRQKTRQRIEQLEGVVKDLESKYSSALQLIQRLEQDKARLQAQVQGYSSLSVSSPQVAASEQVVSPDSSPKLSPTVIVDPSSDLSLQVPFLPSTAPLSSSSSQQQQHKYPRYERLCLPPPPPSTAAQQLATVPSDDASSPSSSSSQHPPVMISRPTAA